MVQALACTTGNLSLQDPVTSLALASTIRGNHRGLRPMEAASTRLFAQNPIYSPRRWMALDLEIISLLTLCRLSIEQLKAHRDQPGETRVVKIFNHIQVESKNSTLLDPPITITSSMTRGSLRNLTRMKALPSRTQWETSRGQLIWARTHLVLDHTIQSCPRPAHLNHSLVAQKERETSLVESLHQVPTILNTLRKLPHGAGSNHLLQRRKKIHGKQT